MKRYTIIAVVFAVILAGIWFLIQFRPVNKAITAKTEFIVSPGDGFSTIADRLMGDGFVRSALAFKLFTLMGGVASSLKPGIYEISPAMSMQTIAHLIASDDARSVTVTIPEGSNVFEIDNILADAAVIKKGTVAGAVIERGIEGTLFPDTYQFINNEQVSDVLKTLNNNFAKKAEPLLAKNPKTASSTLIIASLLEKEVRSDADRRIVAGIMQKRLTAGMTLDIDAAVCYAVQLSRSTNPISCATLTKGDFGIDSPYNMYTHQGLPPGPISNPGVASIQAALNPAPSPYWFYLSDPKTGKTIYARTLDEQNQNIGRYLR